MVILGILFVVVDFGCAGGACLLCCFLRVFDLFVLVVVC